MASSSAAVDLALARIVSSFPRLHDDLARLPNLAARINNPVLKDGSLAVHYAVRTADIPLLKRLIELGADINAPIAHGVTALVLAASRRCSVPLLDVFIALPAADFTIPPLDAVPRSLPDQYIPCPGTPLAHTIFRHQPPAVVMRAIPRLPRADVATPTCLRRAVESGSVPLLRMVMDCGGTADEELLEVLVQRHEREPALCYLIEHTPPHIVRNLPQSRRSLIDNVNSRDQTRLISILTKIGVSFQSDTLADFVRNRLDPPIVHALAAAWQPCFPGQSITAQALLDRMTAHQLHLIPQFYIVEPYLSSKPFICTCRVNSVDAKIDTYIIHDMLLRGVEVIDHQSCHPDIHRRQCLTGDCRAPQPLYAPSSDDHPSSISHFFAPLGSSRRTPPAQPSPVVHPLMRLAMAPWSPLVHPYMYSHLFQATIKFAMLAFTLSPRAIPYELRLLILSYVSRRWFSRIPLAMYRRVEYDTGRQCRVINAPSARDMRIADWRQARGISPD